MSVAVAPDFEIAPGFTTEGDGARWTYAGPLTTANAGAVLAAAAAMALPADGEIDLRDIEAIDSAAVGVLLALQRRAAGEDRTLRLTNAPAALTALAEVYGVEAILLA